MIPLKPKLVLLCLLFCYGTSYGQWSPYPVINDYGGTSLDTLFMSDSTFCKGEILSIGGNEFLSSGIAEIWDSLSIWLGGFPGGIKCDVVSLDSFDIQVIVPDVFLNDTCMNLTLIKYTHSIFGIHPYPVEDTVCLIGDYAQVEYPDSSFCLGDTNPRPTVILSPTTSGVFCCPVGPPGFLVLQDGSIPLHSGSVGLGSQFSFQTLHPVCPDTLYFQVDIIERSSSIFGLAGGDSVFCPVGTAQANTSLLFPSSGHFSCPSSGLIILDDSLGIIDLGASLPGIYQFWYNPDQRCFDSSSIEITVLTPDTADVVYPVNGIVCQDGPPLIPIFGNNYSGGVFTSIPPLFSIGSGGVINPSAVPPGQYTINYHTQGVCPDSTVAAPLLTIDTVTDASFTLSSHQVCSQEDSVYISSLTTGYLAALFSGNVLYTSPGVSVPINGVLGGGSTYQIRHIAGSNCPDTSYQSLTVVQQDNPSFVYNPSFYCIGDPDPIPQILGDGGGLFYASDTATFVAPDGRLNLQASGPGNHNINYLTPGTCPDSSNFTVVINNGVSAFFSYPSSSFCTIDSNPLPTVQTQGGIFSSGSGLFLDSLSGLVGLDQSQPGVYTVTYGFSGSCQTTYSQTISIQMWDTLTRIDYGDGPFCKDSLPVIPTITGDSIGNFLISGGASFFSPSNGAIDLGASPVGGPYFITYDILNICARDVTDTIYISEAPKVELVYPFSYACLGDTPIGLDPSGSIASGVFSFSGGLSGDSSGTVYPSMSQVGSHQISYTSSGVCRVTVEIPFSVNPLPANSGMDLFPNDTVCEGELIRASLSGSDAVAFGFLLNNELADSSFFIFESDSFNNGDLLTGYVRNAYGCTDSFSYHLTLSPKPAATIAVPGDIVTGDKSWIGLTSDLDSTQLDYMIVVSGDSTHGGITLGMAGEGSQMLIRTGRERYDPAKVQVLVIPEYGHCRGDSVWADYLVIENQFFIPEVITPNGDGKNDTWRISWEPETDPYDYEMKLFNRSGGEVLSMSPLHQQFDGGSLPDGVYWWNLKRFDGQQIQSGGLTIHR